MLHLFTLTFAITIPLTILYEKEVENTVGETIQIYLEQLLKNINDHSKTKFELKNVLSHTEYKNDSEYEELSRYAGSDKVNERLNALREIKSNIILAISSNLPEDFDETSVIQPCHVSYMINMNSNNNIDLDLLTNLHKGILHVLSKLHGFVVPNLLDKKKRTEKEQFLKNLENSDLDERMKECAHDLFESDYDEEKGFKSNLLETDALVNEFDKIMNMLKKGKNEDKNDKKSGSENKSKEDKKKDGKEEKESANLAGENLDKTDLKKRDSSENKDLEQKLNLAENIDKKIEKKEIRDERENKEGKKSDDEMNMKEFFRDVISELKSIRSDMYGSNNRRNDYPRNYDRETPSSSYRRDFHSPPYPRHYDEFKNEGIVSVPIEEKDKKYSPFSFEQKKPTIGDLKEITKKK